MTDISTISSAEPPIRGSPRPVPEEIGKARVLVVDDVPENRDLLARRLSRLGITDVTEAENGGQALEQLDRARFDLVLLDIMMPVMNGYQVLERLNADRRIHDLPVIVISALSEMDSIAGCIEQGAEDFLLKPFNPTLLRARVLSSLEKKFLRDRTRLELQRKQAELAEARTLQLALVPPGGRRTGAIGAIAIDLVLDPAKEVGGDLADHFPIGDLHVLVLGDVSDKGAGAALMMARTCALFRSLAARPDAEALFRHPELAMREANATLAASNPACMFVTLWLAALDMSSGVLRHVRAGHVPPFLRRASGALERLDGLGGLPLGVMEDASYSAEQLQLAPGDCLLAVTDGVSEAAAPDGGMFGEDGAAQWLAAARTHPPAISSLVAAVRAHEAGMPPSDDLAGILLCREPRAHADAEHVITLTVVPTPEEVSALVGRALGFLFEAGVDRRAAHHVGLSLDELLTNIGAHGGGEALPCDVSLSVLPDRVSITILDSAALFDPRSAPAPDTEADVESRPIGGLGAYLVLSLAEGFDYRREGGRNATSLWIPRTREDADDANNENEGKNHGAA